jgi:tRNA1Val (adenine37-N6)-methyltransferase
VSEIFKFKQFDLDQEGCAMKMGTDAMLLGSLAQPNDAQNILDIGTGTGVLSLMLAQRCPDAIIDAIEIDTAAANCAQRNFTNSSWDYRLSLYNEPLQQYTNIDVILYEYIICNPPYFEPSPTTREDRVNARTTVALTHEDLIYYADKLLDGRGIFGVILPEQASENFIVLATEKNLSLKREVLISSFKNSEIIRRVLEFSKEKVQTTTQEHLYIYDSDKSWSKEYTGLTKDFHLVEKR